MVVVAHQGRRLNDLGVRALTDGRTDRRTEGRTDGRYQAHYLPALLKLRGR